MNEEIRVIQPRFLDTGKETLGNWIVMRGNQPIFSCVTLELPYLDNQKRISCIEKGIYDCVKVERSSSFDYFHFSILNVSGRSGIKVHIANYVRQLRGCVAVGEKHIDIDSDNQSDVTNSTATLKKLIEILPDKFTIEII